MYIVKLSCILPSCFLLSATAPCLAGVLHTFSSLSNGTNSDGANPMAGLTLSGGRLYGTATYGGLKGAGTAFSLSPDSSGFTVFHSFTNPPNAGTPQADLVSSGVRFFGTSFGGGNKGVGAVFVAQTNGTVTTVFNCLALDAHTATNINGACPAAAVVLLGNTAFGVASAGGAAANGVIFSVATNGSTSAILHSFSALDSNTGTNTDGAVPFGTLMLSGSTLYGTTSAGGAGGNGTVFSVDTSGNNFTTLYSFSAMDPVTGTNDDGAMPYAGLILSNGVLYGTAMAGGFGHSGVVFSIDTNGNNFTVLHHFAPTDPITETNADGARPVAGLTLAGGTLYGMASAGGSGASGSLFSLDTSGGSFQLLYQFSAVNPADGSNADGASPAADLLLYSNSLYGTTSMGGSAGAGTIFNISLPRLPATINGIVLNLDGGATLSFLGSPASTNVVQATIDLGTGPWQDISTNVADAGGFWQSSDPDAGLYPTRFYRTFSH